MTDFNINKVCEKNFFTNSVKSAPKVYIKDSGLKEDTLELSCKKTEKKRSKFNKFIDKIFKYKTECTDNKDDGKLSTKEKIHSVIRGSANLITNLIDSVIEHPVATIGAMAATVGISAILTATGIVSAPVLAIAGSAIGLGFGAFKIGSGIIKANKAETDTDAKLAYEAIGEGSTDFIISSLSLAKGIKSAKKIKQIALETKEYADKAKVCANKTDSNLKKVQETVKKSDEIGKSIEQSADEAKRIKREIDKITEGASECASEIKNAEIEYSKISRIKNNSINEVNNSSNMRTRAENFSKEAHQYTEMAEKAAVRARKANTVKQAVKQKEIAEGAYQRVYDISNYSKENLLAVRESAATLELNSTGIRTNLEALNKTMIEADSKVSGFDYGRVSYDTDNIAAYDPSGIDDRSYMRTKIEMESTLADAKLHTKTTEVTGAALKPQLDKSCKYYSLGEPKVHSKTKQLSYAIPNLELAADGNGVRGKTPLAGKPGRMTPVLNSVKKANIRTVIDLRAEGVCSNNALKTLDDLGIKYVNFPVDDTNWKADSLHKITEYINAVNDGDYFVGCANGESRTDIAVMINYLLNPKAKNVPKLMFGTKSTTRKTLADNMNQILNLIKDAPEILKEWGWQSMTDFNETYTTRYNSLYATIGNVI